MGKLQKIVKSYKPQISATVNRKGVLDVDSVKGCRIGMENYPNGGCYGLCYAAKIAKFYKYDFKKSVSRKIEFKNPKQLKLFDNLWIDGPSNVYSMVKKNKLGFFRIGTMGDPCHDWGLTVNICEWLGRLCTPVIVTKHWIKISDQFVERIKKTKAVFNTSISPLDSDYEINERIFQFERIKSAGIRSVLRVVSCDFGNTVNGNILARKQNEIFKNYPLIDNPLRIPATDKRVLSGDILITKIKDLNTDTNISLFNKKTYIGHCGNCPDQCGVL